MSSYGIGDFIRDIICEVDAACDVLSIILTIISLIGTYSTEIFIIIFAILMIASSITMYLYLTQPNEREGRKLRFED